MQPWMAGIFSASLFLVGLNWFFTVFPRTTFRAGMFFGYLPRSFTYALQLIMNGPQIPKTGICC